MLIALSCKNAFTTRCNTDRGMLLYGLLLVDCAVRQNVPQILERYRTSMHYLAFRMCRSSASIIPAPKPPWPPVSRRGSGIRAVEVSAVCIADFLFLVSRAFPGRVSMSPAEMLSRDACVSE